MKMTNLNQVLQSLEGRAGKRVIVDSAVAEKARLTLNRMLDMSKRR